MKSYNNRWTLCIIYFIFTIPFIAYSQGSNYQVVGKIEIGGENKFDYLSIEQTSQRLFVSNFSKVHVIDLKTNKVVGVIENQHGVHGIAFAPEFNKGFITNGGDNTVTVFDLKTLKVLKSIPVTGKKPDAIAYDPSSQRIFAFNGGTNNATAIDAKTNDTVGTVSLEGAPEFAVPDTKGKMYVNLEDKNAVQVFDPQTLKIITKYPTTPAATPTGLAYDIKDNILFSVGRNRMAAVLDVKSGKVINALKIGDGVDACAYDADNKLIFCSNKDGTLTVISQESPLKYKVIDNVKTAQGAKTMALDKATHKIYLSAMLDISADPTKPAKKVFGVLILEKK